MGEGSLYYWAAVRPSHWETLLIMLQIRRDGANSEIPQLSGGGRSPKTSSNLLSTLESCCQGMISITPKGWHLSAKVQNSFMGELIISTKINIVG